MYFTGSADRESVEADRAPSSTVLLEGFMLEKYVVTVSWKSLAFRLLSLLALHGLVEDFNAEQKAVQVPPDLTCVVVRWPYWGPESEQHQVTYEFDDGAADAVLDWMTISTDGLLARLLQSFEDNEFAKYLLAVPNGSRDIADSYEGATYDFLLANAGLEWRGIINEDWPALQYS